MIEVTPQEIAVVFGFGVAGNFAGHLEQAGEAADFTNVTASADAPKGIFPWYVPGGGEGTVPEFLATDPVSSDAIELPRGALDLQIEPEVGVVADVIYDADGTVTAVKPVYAGAFNDCSIRREGASKISEKKNWGAASKGFAARVFEVTDLTAEGPTAGFRLASFLVRDGQSHSYGQDSALAEYSYYGDQLLDWIVDRLAHQHGSDDTPLEDVGGYLRSAGGPDRVLIGIGATRYTEFGESNFLQEGDDSVVVVYDSAVHTPEQVASAVAAGGEAQLTAASVLRQRVKTV